MKKRQILKIIIAVAVFWILDFVLHFVGVGESNYYYFIKFANATLFAFIWFRIYDKKTWKSKLIFSVIFGTWISFFYVLSAYSGFVQWLGIYARYSAPPFVIFGIILPAFFWWVWHIISFYLGLEATELIHKKRK